MEDRLLFGGGGGDWHSEEPSSVGCPWISSVVTQPALHGDHLGNYEEQGRLQCWTAHFKGLHQMNSYSTLVNFHTSNPPHPSHSSSLTTPLLMPAGILTVLMNITPPPHHKHTLLATAWWKVHDVLYPLSRRNTKRCRPQWRTTVPSRHLPYSRFYQLRETERFQIQTMLNIPLKFVKPMWHWHGRNASLSKLKFSIFSDVDGEDWGFRLVLNQKRDNHKIVGVYTF